MRCRCAACQLAAALELLHSGRVSMGILLVEQALQTLREQAERSWQVKPAARTQPRKARARP
jgi:hypothetical protein